MMSAQKSLSKRTGLRRVLHRLMLGEDGAALVEATLIAPILVAMGVYAADFGLLFYTKMQVQNAAQAGAQWAIANRIFNATDVQTAGTNATTLTGVTFTPTPSQFCGCSKDSSGNLAVTQLSASACTTPAPGATCNTSGVAGNYVKVTATKSYSSFVPYGLVTSTYNISATTTVRIQ